MKVLCSIIMCGFVCFWIVLVLSMSLWVWWIIIRVVSLMRCCWWFWCGLIRFKRLCCLCWVLNVRWFIFVFCLLVWKLVMCYRYWCLSEMLRRVLLFIRSLMVRRLRFLWSGVMLKCSGSLIGWCVGWFWKLIMRCWVRIWLIWLFSFLRFVVCWVCVC